MMNFKSTAGTLVRWGVILIGLLSLSACSKTVQYEEEVEIDGKPYRAERKDTFEKRYVQLNLEYWSIKSEVLVKGLDLPRWQSELAPMYLGQNNAREYVLVAYIGSAAARRKRSSPSIPYAAFRVENGQWVETPVPPEFHGRTPTFLLGSDPVNGEKPLVTKSAREFRQKVQLRGSAASIDLKFADKQGSK